MRKSLFVLLFSFLSVVVQSQIFIGGTESQIREMIFEKEGDNVEIKVGYTYEDSTKFIWYYVDTPDSTFYAYYYYFDDNDVCNMISLKMNYMSYLNDLIELYNNSYVNIDVFKWRAWLENGNYLDIILEYNTRYRVYSFIYL